MPDGRKGLGTLPVIASEAKQSISPRKERMDCFVARAPRNDGSFKYDFAFSRHDLPEVLHFVCPRNQRAQGRPGARRTRGLVRKTVHQTRARAYRFGGNTPAFPAQWLYGLYDFVLVTGFLATIVSFGFRFRRLDASTGASDPNDFTVRLSHARQSQPSRPPLPAPTSATMANAPLTGRDGGSCRCESSKGESGIFFRRRLDGANRPELVQEIRVNAHGALDLRSRSEQRGTR
jgi:hypothetical protein